VTRLDVFLAQDVSETFHDDLNSAVEVMASWVEEIQSYILLLGLVTRHLLISRYRSLGSVLTVDGHTLASAMTGASP